MKKMIKLYNSLTKSVEEFTPINDSRVTIYSCGPTVYNPAHIGNLVSYIFADTLRRVLKIHGYNVQHAMNYTDVDDKTIKKSQELYPNEEAKSALKQLTSEIETQFNRDLHSIGIDENAMSFIRATDSINSMQQLIRELLDAGIAYPADDGIYFSIEKYRESGHIYGQLSEITAESTGAARVDNDEYDKENVHDFALWKKQQPNEPSWKFEIDSQNFDGRPGWHIECSAMAREALSQPIDIHTGGIDLIFPHHENEIAQSTGSGHYDKFANFFVHSEHLLVDNRKMAKSLGNVYLISDVVKRDISPLAFRLLVLQAHYQKQAHFSWSNLESAQNRLNTFRSLGAMIYQPNSDAPDYAELISKTIKSIKEALFNNLDTPKALSALSPLLDRLLTTGLPEGNLVQLKELIEIMDQAFGLQLGLVEDIDEETKKLINQREELRANQMFGEADEIRDKLKNQGIELKDLGGKTLWLF
jgi:cysteinyl-tRNA synthetase